MSMIYHMNDAILIENISRVQDDIEYALNFEKHLEDSLDTEAEYVKLYSVIQNIISLVTMDGVVGALLWSGMFKSKEDIDNYKAVLFDFESELLNILED